VVRQPPADELVATQQSNQKAGRDRHRAAPDGDDADTDDGDPDDRGGDAPGTEASSSATHRSRSA
jgi:hypothetical protein